MVLGRKPVLVVGLAGFQRFTVNATLPGTVVWRNFVWETEAAVLLMATR